MDSDIVINNNQATWKMPITDGELGGTYTGTFVFRCYLDPLVGLQAGREFRELLGSLGTQAPDAEKSVAYALTQLKHRIISAPPFWTTTLQESGMAGNIGDLNIISMVLGAAMKSEDLFKDKIFKERDALLEKSIKLGEKILEEKAKEE